MRKQSWQVRLIPLFYSAGIIKGLSNNNYAPKVDTPLSCSRCEWQRGVCATERKSTSRRGGGKGAGVCKCAWRCVRTHAWEVEKGEVKLAVNSKTQVFQKQAHTSLISPQHTAVNSKLKKQEFSRATGNADPWESPTRNIWKSGMRERWAGDSQLPSLCRRGVDWVTPLCGADRRWSNVRWHRSITAYLPLIDWPYTGDYR